MRVRCRVYYQGENNAGGLHGNAGTKDQPPSGYACMMPKLVSLFRKEWSKEPGTTEPTAAFGIVSLSSHDSEGAKDMASFRCKPSPTTTPLRDCCDVSSDGHCCEQGRSRAAWALYPTRSCPTHSWHMRSTFKIPGTYLTREAIPAAELVAWKRSGAKRLLVRRNGGPSGQQKSGACVEKPSLLPDYDCATPWFMGPGTSLHTPTCPSQPRSRCSCI